LAANRSVVIEENPPSSDDERLNTSSVKINPKLCHLGRDEALREMYPLHTLKKEQVSRSQLQIFDNFQAAQGLNHYDDEYIQ